MTRGGRAVVQGVVKAMDSLHRLKASEAIMGYRKGCRRSGCSKGKLAKSSGNQVLLWTLGQEVITKEL